ncbi:MAG: hypothetical protein M0Z89_09425 [Nitrospiraceae bacterium]|nr:hypothetical protein [Nitrospiraceae bacterium]
MAIQDLLGRYKWKGCKVAEKKAGKCCPPLIHLYYFFFVAFFLIAFFFTAFFAPQRVPHAIIITPFFGLLLFGRASPVLYLPVLRVEATRNNNSPDVFILLDATKQNIQAAV